MDVNALLKDAVAQGASDIHIKVGSHPILRIHGNLVPFASAPKLTHEDVVKTAFAVMTPAQGEVFKKKNDIDFAYSIPGLGRFRCNAFVQRGSVGVVFRAISMKIPGIEELNLPVVLKKLAGEERGLVLVTGTTGSGKSTTLAAMIDLINSSRTVNIVTIEDPVEYLHKDKKGIVNQREVGTDTESFAKALRAALRQDPDVILVGEMRDFETIQTAMSAAETGHLVFSTLHTLDASETINRIISVFPPYQHKQVRMQLSSILKGIISQRLVPRADGKGRVPAVEVLIATAMIRDCIIEPDKTKMIPDAVAQGKVHYGMQTFDQSLFDLLNSGMITYEEALRWATNPDDFKLKVRGIRSTSDLTTESDKVPGGFSAMPGIDRFSK
ncbi:MAG: type IV pilus twitching motility protein PilT [Thermodesulfovibrionales bacterium]|nr:type IV pilus twitching motility protein PilT [Thermodesulfovibrionales bacterium]